MWLAATRSSRSCGSGGPAETDCPAAGRGGASMAPSATSAPAAKRRRVSSIMASPMAREYSGRRYGLAVTARGDREAVALPRVGVGRPAGGRRRDRAEHRPARHAVDGRLGDERFERLGQRAARDAIRVHRRRDGLHVAPGLGRAGQREVLAHRLLLALASGEREQQRRHDQEPAPRPHPPAFHVGENPTAPSVCARIIRRSGGRGQAAGSSSSTHSKESAMSIKRHGVGPRLSQAVVHGNTVYLAGIVAGDPSADAKGQTEQILKKIDEHLTAVGSHKSKLLSATIYVANMGLYNDMNAAWDAWIDLANTPARATVEARLATPKFLVEI